LIEENISAFQPVPQAWKLPSLAFPTGVIAGGAVRDFMLAAEPRDIDLFVPDLPEVHKAIAALGAQPVLKYAEYGRGSRTFAAYVLEQPGGLPPLNIVVVKGDHLDPTALISDFDFGICQASYSVRDGFRFTEAFFADLAAGTLTYFGPPNRRKRSLGRYEKFVQRPQFAGWRLVGLTPRNSPTAIKFTRSATPRRWSRYAQDGWGGAMPAPSLTPAVTPGGPIFSSAKRLLSHSLS
jgi:hypothetical protein